MTLPSEHVKIDSKGRLLIPSRFRKALSIQEGSIIEVFLYGKNNLLLRLLSSQPVKTLCIGCGKTEDEVKMVARATKGQVGICQNCHKKGLTMKEIK